MCTHDFGLEVQGIPEKPIHLKIVLFVTDSDDSPRDVWEGTLDLAQGSGFEIIDNEPLEHFCTNS